MLEAENTGGSEVSVKTAEEMTRINQPAEPRVKTVNTTARRIEVEVEDPAGVGKQADVNMAVEVYEENSVGAVVSVGDLLILL